ncbi:unnamed protein product [Caenorhabditis nigoni]
MSMSPKRESPAFIFFQVYHPQPEEVTNLLTSQQSSNPLSTHITDEMQHYDNKSPQISPTVRRHSSNVKTYDAIQFRDKLRRGVSLENLGPHRVCFYPHPAPSNRNPPINRTILFSKNPIGPASKNISRKVSSYSKMSSIARVAWVTLDSLIKDPNADATWTKPNADANSSSSNNILMVVNGSLQSSLHKQWNPHLLVIETTPTPSADAQKSQTSLNGSPALDSLIKDPNADATWTKPNADANSSSSNNILMVVNGSLQSSLHKQWNPHLLVIETTPTPSADAQKSQVRALSQSINTLLNN